MSPFVNLDPECPRVLEYTRSRSQRPPPVLYPPFAAPSRPWGTLAIPAVGYLVSAWIINANDADLAKEGLPSIETICLMREILPAPAI